MKAKTHTGQIINLPQDACGCHNHQGPHWLYSNDLAAEKNRQNYLAPALESLNRNCLTMTEMAWVQALLIGFARREAARLEEKRLNMARWGIVEIIQEDQIE